MAKSPEESAHLEWLGYVQPVGLVVSVPAMLEAQCYVNKNIMAEHSRFLGSLPRDASDSTIPEIRDLSEFTQKVLDWDANDLTEIPERVALTGEMAPLEVVLPQYHETLRPTHAVPVFQPAEGQSPWMMLIQELSSGTPLDEPSAADSARHWNASPQAKFERLLRETGVPIGLLSNRRSLRLVYAPRGESSGYATFHVAEMMQVAGRPVFAALQMLLCAERLFSLGEKQRLPAILESSRKYQNTVSTKLAEQVLAALYEMMRGFQAANDVRQGELLREVLANNPQHIYHGLLTVLMRLVFVLYAEDRSLMSSDPVYSNHYSVTGLFERLRSDAGRFPDTMDQRFGAWAQLLTLFRLVFHGGQHGDFKLPARKGYLFDPNRYPFLEGRYDDGNVNVDSQRELDSAIQVPRVSDGVIYRILEDLLVLEGERLSYRTLDVEQIGSVYETVMGFELHVAQGRSIAIKPTKTHGAPATIDLESLLAAKGKDRAKWLKEQSDQGLGREASVLLKDAQTIEQLLEALDKKIAKKVTPRVVPAGAMVLQPSDERRRSGSHYTPRALTEPIVRTTLEPILKRLVDSGVELPAVYEPSREDKRRYTKGELEARIRQSEKGIEHARLAREVGTPHPTQILDLKICDPAMGSGAFLVETCRQLGDELVKAWYAHDLLPTDIPPDEDELLYARRLVAQRCLYGVDRNPMAVDLAKLSLWLVTLARDHSFTFLDHALRYGDSLVGLTRRQIIGFHWDVKKQKQFGEELIQKRLDRAIAARVKILNARQDEPYRDQEQRLALADEALNVVRLTGDACVSAFFAGSKKKAREERCDALFADISQHYQNLQDGTLDVAVRDRIAQAAASLRAGEHPLPPFHWEVEYPEVFSRDNGGFDAFVGNPPFAGKNTMAGGNRAGYPDWLKELHAESHGNADLVAHFFRACFNRLRHAGTFGLIATNTIGQGDTRSTGLRWICEHQGEIYHARKRVKWPGLAAVVVSVIHVHKGPYAGPRTLDDRPVNTITAFLFHRGGHADPARLRANAGKSFQGSIVLGMGFTFDDTSSSGVATPLAVMEDLIAKDPRNAERIFPYIGGEEINSNPKHLNHRYIIDFADMNEEEAATWPELYAIVRERVRPQRLKDKRLAYRKYWWQFAEKRGDLRIALRKHRRILAISEVTSHIAFAFVGTHHVFAHTLKLFMLDGYDSFAVVQSTVHGSWARIFGSSMKDDLRYTPSDCFETFPFPVLDATEQATGTGDDLDSLPSSAPTYLQILEQVGREYYEFRAALMVKNNEGLTKTYNRFHDPHEESPEILKLRELHEAMDRAVLEAYGWHDLAQGAQCDFLLDYEEEEDEENGKRSKRKKPWRLRWPDEFRDEVLARLLELNARRHEEERLAGVPAAKGDKGEKGEKRTKNTEAVTKRVKQPPQDQSSQKELF
jgi:hypothetical protein